MLPRKTKELIPDYATLKDIPEEDLQDIITFFYRDIVRCAEELVHPRIGIPGLGTLEFKDWILEKEKWMGIYGVKKYQLMEWSPGTQTAIANEGNDFTKIMKVLEQDKKKKLQVKENRKKGIYSKNYYTPSRIAAREQAKQQSHDTKGQTTEGLGEQAHDS